MSLTLCQVLFGERQQQISTSSQKSGVYALPSERHWSRTHLDRPCWLVHRLVGCVLVPVAVSQGAPQLASSSLKGLSPQFLTILGGLLPGAWDTPFYGNADRAQGNFGATRYVLGIVGWTHNKYRPQCWAGTHLDWPCWLIHGSGWVWPGSASSQSRPNDKDSGWLSFMLGMLRPASSSLRGPSPQAVTLLGEARFITRCLRHLFLGECWWGPRHFWRCWVYLNYSPAPGLT